MKKIRFILLIILSFCFLSFAGCSSFNSVLGDVSELRENLFSASTSTAKVTAITGKKETPYVLDGKSGEKAEFTVITYTPNEFVAGKEFNYKAVINEKEYSGKLTIHPFGKSYSVDINAQTKGESIDITISEGDYSENFKLVSAVSKDMITAERAYEIAISRLKKQVASLKNEGRKGYEIYVRITENPIDNSGGYFWYVAFVGENQTTFAALIDAKSEEIVAIRD